MHSLEPFYNWRNLYIASEDELSPFYGREYSEFEYSNSIYNYLIHPQWDNIGSETLYIKILFIDYDEAYVIIEMIGEWNDCVNNDIMFLKREIADELIYKGINKFILVAENVLNFHASDDEYYAEWFDDVDDGWIAVLNLRKHIYDDFKQYNIDSYLVLGGKLNEIEWRTLSPKTFFDKVNEQVMKRIV